MTSFAFDVLINRFNNFVSRIKGVKGVQPHYFSPILSFLFLLLRRRAPSAAAAAGLKTKKGPSVPVPLRAVSTGVETVYFSLRE
jgi:hypothetical protein